MEEHLSWRIVYIGAIFSLVVLCGAYFLISPRDSTYFSEEKTDKIAAFANMRVYGRKEGKKAWELLAQSGWTTKNYEITYLTQIMQGVIYKKEKPSINHLSAKEAKAYIHSNVIDLSGLKADINIDNQWAKLTADNFRYLPNDKRAEMSGNVIIRKKNERLEAGTVRYFSEEERTEAAGGIKLSIAQGKIRTQLKAEHGTSFADKEKDMTFGGSLEVVQGKIVAVANEGFYSRAKNELKLKGNVNSVFEKAKVLLSDDTVKKLKNKEAREILWERTVVTSDELIFFTKNGNSRALGNVHVSQKKREAKSDAADYDEKKELLTLTGNVQLKKGSDWVHAQKVLVYIKKEAFEAVGSVEAEFKL